MSWSTMFDDPVPGCRTLRDAANYIQKLPRAEQEQSRWQAAAEALIMAAEGKGPLMHARIGMLKALNFGEAKPILERRRQAKSYRIIR